MSVSLAAWLTQIWDEDEDAAKRLGDRVWFVCNDGHLEEPLLKDETGEYERWEDGEYRLPNHHNTWLPALDPAAMLARIAADRQILALHHPDRPLEGWYWTERSCAGCGRTWHKWLPDKRPTEIGPEQGCPTLRLLALPYADRPGYREEWRP